MLERALRRPSSVALLALAATVASACSGKVPGEERLGVTLVASIASGSAPLTVAFTAEPIGVWVPESYTWTFGDDSDPVTTTEPSVVHELRLPGTYEVYVVATLGQLAAGSDRALIVVGPPFPLEVAISALPPGGVAPLEVALTAEIDGGIHPYSYEWQLGDGTASSDEDPVHTFEEPGELTISLTVTDSVGTSDDAQLVLTVESGENAPPVAVEDEATTEEDTAVDIDVLANDSDPEGDGLTITAVGAASNGTVSITAGRVRYVPNENFNGVDSFSYTISDDGSGELATASVSVAIDPVNDAPDVANDTAVLAEDGILEISVLTNDTDVDGDLLTVQSVGSASNGTVAIGAGSTSVIYTPDADFNGSDSFTYGTGDGMGGATTGTVDVSVTAANDAPVAVADEVTTEEEVPVTVTALLNDTDVDLDALAVVEVSAPANGTAVVTEGGIVYTPAADFDGEDGFDYTIADSAGAQASATVTIQVTPVNDAPVITNPEALLLGPVPALITDDIVLQAQPTTADVDGDAVTLAYTWEGRPAGSLDPFAELASGSGVTLIPALPAAQLTPDYAYRLVVAPNDGTVDGTSVTTPAVSLGTSPPVALADAVTTDEDEAVVVDVLFNDTDADGDDLVVTAVGTASNGTATLAGDGLSVTYLPDLDYHGLDSFTYTISDGTEGGEDDGTVSVTVSPVNDDPVAVNDEASLAEDGSVVIDVRDNDSDVDGDAVTIDGVGTPANGTAAVEVDATLGQVVRYTPGADFNGADAFGYTLGDGHGGQAGASVAITVMPANDAPLITNPAALLIGPVPPLVTGDLFLQSQPVTSDVDGDDVTLGFAWQGRPAGTADPFQTVLDGTGTEVPPLTADHLTGDFSYRLVVFPNDGFVDGEAVTTPAVTLGNTPPTIDQAALTLTPSPAVTTDALALVEQPTATDPDGDAVLFNVTWQARVEGLVYVDIPEAGETGVAVIASLDPSFTVRDTNYRAVIRPTDGTDEGPALTTNAVRVVNSAPVLDAAGLLTSVAGTTVDLVLVSAPAASDADPEDTPVFEYQWQVATGADGPFDDLAGADSASLPASVTVRDRWYRLSVVASDGELDSAPGVTNATSITNTAPMVTNAPALTPSAPVTTDDLGLGVPVEGADDDEDAVAFLYQWQASTTGLEGDFLAVDGATSAGLDDAVTSKHAFYRLSITPTDGDLDGAPYVTDAVQVQNSAPAITSLPAITPPAPSADDDLQIDVLAIAATDADPEDAGVLTVSIAHWRSTVDLAGAWTVIPDSAAATLGNALTERGVYYQACARATDPDDADSPVACGEPVVVGNSPPTITHLPPLTPAAPHTVDALGLSGAIEATDPDGGDITFEYRWEDSDDDVDFAAIGGATSAVLAAATTAKNVYYRVCVTPRDDLGVAGATLCTASVRVLNSLPQITNTPQVTPPFPDTTGPLGRSPLPQGSDADPEDFVVFLYQWEESAVGADTGFAPLDGATGGTLAAALTFKNHWYRLVITPFDGQHEGTPYVTPSTFISNVAPTVTGIPALEPPSPVTTDDLSVEVAAITTQDGDADDVTVSIAFWRWSPNPAGGIWNVVSGSTSATLGSALTVRGRHYAVCVRGNDGEVDGPIACSDSVLVGNSPPALTSIPTALQPAAPRTADDLSFDAGAVGTSDPDADDVTVAVQWEARTGTDAFAAVAGGTANPLPASLTQTGYEYRACLTPVDVLGLSGATECTTATVVVINTAPVIAGSEPAVVEDICPEVTAGVRGIENDEQSTEGVVVTVVGDDPDGDPLAYYHVEGVYCGIGLVSGLPPHKKITGIGYDGAIPASFEVIGEGRDQTLVGPPVFGCEPCDDNGVHDPDECSFVLLPLDPAPGELCFEGKCDLECAEEDCADGTDPDQFRYRSYSEDGTGSSSSDWGEFGQEPAPPHFVATDGDAWSDITRFEFYTAPDGTDAPVAQDDALADELGFMEDAPELFVPVSRLLIDGTSTQRDYDLDIPDAFPRFWSDPCATGVQTFHIAGLGLVAGGHVDEIGLVTLGDGLDYVRLVPELDFNSVDTGELASFEYQLQDSTGLFSSWATVSFEVAPVEEPAGVAIVEVGCAWGQGGRYDCDAFAPRIGETFCLSVVTDADPPDTLTFDFDGQGPTPLNCHRTWAEQTSVAIVATVGAASDTVDVGYRVRREGHPGSVVLIGHDFSDVNGESASVLGNAVLLGADPHRLMRVGGYTEFADASSVAIADLAIAESLAAYGRDYELGEMAHIDSAEQLPEALESFDVLVIYDQVNAGATELFDLGAGLGREIQDFVDRGGVLVVLDYHAADGEVGGTWRVLEGAGLLFVEGVIDTTGAFMDLLDPLSPLARDAQLGYEAQLPTVRFVTSEGTPVFGNLDLTGAVVIHRRFAPPGRVVLLGLDFADLPSDDPAARVLTNAVFTSVDPGPDPVIALYAHYDPSAEQMANVDEALTFWTDQLERGAPDVVRTAATTAADLTDDLIEADADALVLLDGAGGDVDPGLLGEALAPALRDFLARGGAIVVLDGDGQGGTLHADLFRVLDGAGLVDVTGAVGVPGGVALIEDTESALTRGVAGYDLPASSLFFESIDADAPVTLDLANGEPVLLDARRPDCTAIEDFELGWPASPWEAAIEGAPPVLNTNGHASGHALRVADWHRELQLPVEGFGRGVQAWIFPGDSGAPEDGVFLGFNSGDAGTDAVRVTRTGMGFYTVPEWGTPIPVGEGVGLDNLPTDAWVRLRVMRIGTDPGNGGPVYQAELFAGDQSPVILVETLTDPMPGSGMAIAVSGLDVDDLAICR